MTLQQLEYVIAVANIGNFAKAAEACHVTQPTLSTMIQKLEEEIEAKIFDRSHQPIRPTPVGVHIIKQAQNVIEQAKNIKEIVRESRQSLSGTFRIGILPTIAPYLLPRFLPTLTKKHPEIDIRVAEMKTSQIKDALKKGEIDAGILAMIPEMSDYDHQSLFYEQYFAYVSSDSRLYDLETIRTSDLVNEELWLLDQGHCFRDQLIKFCQLKSARKSRVTYNLGTLETFMRMVENGRGVTFIPALAVEQLSETQRKLVRPFAIPCPTRQIILITNTDYIRRLLIETISNEIRESVPNNMLKIKLSQALV